MVLLRLCATHITTIQLQRFKFRTTKTVLVTFALKVSSGIFVQTTDLRDVKTMFVRQSQKLDIAISIYSQNCNKYTPNVT